MFWIQPSRLRNEQLNILVDAVCSLSYPWEEDGRTGHGVRRQQYTLLSSSSSSSSCLPSLPTTSPSHYPSLFPLPLRPHPPLIQPVHISSPSSSPYPCYLFPTPLTTSPSPYPTSYHFPSPFMFSRPSSSPPPPHPFPPLI